MRRAQHARGRRCRDIVVGAPPQLVFAVYGRWAWVRFGGGKPVGAPLGGAGAGLPARFAWPAGISRDADPVPGNSGNRHGPRATKSAPRFAGSCNSRRLLFVVPAICRPLQDWRVLRVVLLVSLRHNIAVRGGRVEPGRTSGPSLSRDEQTGSRDERTGGCAYP